MNNKFVVKCAAESLKKYGPMASIVLSCCLRDDYGVDVSSTKLAHIIKICGKERIMGHPAIKKIGFGPYGTNKGTMIYEVQIL